MIQIDMQMPENCFHCPACNDYLMCAIPINGRKWGENDVREFGQSRPEWCPMKEQEAVEPLDAYFDLYKSGGMFHCGHCKELIVKNQKYCHNCGKMVKWK